MAAKKPTKKSKINMWKPKPDVYDKKTKKITKYSDEIKVLPDGKVFVCRFDKILHNDNYKPYTKFSITKSSYQNQLELITKYINFFMHCYDQDNELVTAYLKVKSTLDKDKMWNKDNMQGYIDFIYDTLFTQTMVKKIEDMVEENYLDDIECNTEAKKKYKMNEKKHLESLEFTNMHIKILLRISFGMKVMSPLMLHYLAINDIKIEKDSDIIFNFYIHLFDIMGYGDKFQLYKLDGELVDDIMYEPSEIQEMITDGIVKKSNKFLHRYYCNAAEMYYAPNTINMYNKLFTYIKTKVMESNSNNAPIYEQREILGIDPYSVMKSFTRKVIISENMVKYKFNEKWNEKTHKYRENIIGFNKTIIKFQLSYFLKEKYGKNLTEVTYQKNADGLSGTDKMEMNMQKVDEGNTTMAEFNIEQTTKRIFDRSDIEISDEEVDYYIQYHKPEELHYHLVYRYYAKDFGSQRDLALLPRRDYIRLALLLKKKLLLTHGDEFEYEDGISTAILPYILTSNIEGKPSTRLIRNTKFLNKLESNYMYNLLVDYTYKELESIHPGFVKQLLSSYVNTTFSYVTYEQPELLGVPIESDEDKISDEILFFLTSTDA